MTRSLATLLSAALLAACMSAPALAPGTDDCAEEGAPCPAECVAVRAAALDGAHACLQPTIALCSRRPLGMQAINQCCVRTSDERIFWLDGSIRCPQEPAHVGWRDCTPSENDALMATSSVCP